MSDDDLLDIPEFLRNQPNPAIEKVANMLVGRKFTDNEKEYVITWNDHIHLRATPLDCKTGLTSKEFRVDDIGLINMRKSN